MTSTALENARRRREELAERINRAQQELDECRPALARVEQFISDYEAFDAGEIPGDAADAKRSNPPARTASRRNSSKEEVSRHARMVIEEAGKPVPRESMYRMLLARGLTIEGNDREGVMNTMIWRTKDEIGVIHLRNVGYWLKEKAWEPAQYNPDDDDVSGSEDDPPSEDLETATF